MPSVPAILASGNGNGIATCVAGNVLYASGTNTWAAGTPDAAGLLDKSSTAQTKAGNLRVAELGIGRDAEPSYSIATNERVYFGGTLDATSNTNGTIARFGANGVAGIISISFSGSNETIFTGSVYGATVIASAGNQDIELRPNGTGILQVTGKSAFSDTIKLASINTGSVAGTAVGQIVYSTSANALKTWNGSSWI